MNRDSNQDLLERGIRLVEAGRFDDAIACLSAIDAEPFGQQALSFLGRAYLEVDDPEQAEQCFRELYQVSADPRVPFWLGEALFAQGRIDAAEENFSRAQRWQPDLVDPWMMLGHCKMARDDVKGAIDAYQQALLLDRAHVGARYYLAEALVASDDIVRATGQIHFILQQRPDYVPAILLLAEIAQIRGDFRQVVVECCRAIELEDVGSDVYEILARAYEELEEKDQALLSYQTAVRKDASAWSSSLAAARLLEDRRAYRQARRYYEAALGDPDLRAEAQTALERLDEYLSQFNLGEPQETEAAESVEAPTHFAAPRTLDLTTMPSDQLRRRSQPEPEPAPAPIAGSQPEPKIKAALDRITGGLHRRLFNDPQTDI